MPYTPNGDNDKLFKWGRIGNVHALHNVAANLLYLCEDGNPSGKHESADTKHAYGKAKHFSVI